MTETCSIARIWVHVSNTQETLTSLERALFDSLQPGLAPAVVATRASSMRVGEQDLMSDNVSYQ